MTSKQWFFMSLGTQLMSIGLAIGWNNWQGAYLLLSITVGCKCFERFALTKELE